MYWKGRVNFVTHTTKARVRAILKASNVVDSTLLEIDELKHKLLAANERRDDRCWNTCRSKASIKIQKVNVTNSSKVGATEVNWYDIFFNRYSLKCCIKVERWDFELKTSKKSTMQLVRKFYVDFDLEDADLFNLPNSSRQSHLWISGKSICSAGPRQIQKRIRLQW